MSQTNEAALDGGQVEETTMDFPEDVSTPTEEASQEASQEHPADSAVQNLNDTQPAPQEEPDPMDSMRQQLAAVMGQLSLYKQKELEGAQQAPQAPKEDAQAEGLRQVPTGQVSQLDFLQGEDHVAILEDPAKFNNLLNKVATVAFNAAVNAAQEQVMRRIPSIVSSSAQQQMAIGDVTKEFYASNQDLAPFKQAVSMAAMQLYQENPNLALPELLAQAATRTREVLHLKGQVPGRKRVPAQPAGNSVQGGVNRTASDPQLSEQQKQIMDLLDF